MTSSPMVVTVAVTRVVCSATSSNSAGIGPRVLSGEGLTKEPFFCDVPHMPSELSQLLQLFQENYNKILKLLES